MTPKPPKPLTGPLHLTSAQLDLRCPHCVYQTTLGPGSVWTEYYVCPGCRGLVSAATEPFRFEKPQCPDCKEPLSLSDRAKYKFDPPRFTCPQCDYHMQVLPSSILDAQFTPVGLPMPGQLVHGAVVNGENGAEFQLAWIQTAYLMHEHGRMPAAGTPVEARVHRVTFPGGILEPPRVFLLLEEELRWEDF